MIPLLDLGHRTVLHREQHVASLLGMYIGTGNTFTLQRGVRHDQHVLVYMGVRYDVASAPKNCGGRPGWGRDKISLYS